MITDEDRREKRALDIDEDRARDAEACEPERLHDYFFYIKVDDCHKQEPVEFYRKELERFAKELFEIERVEVKVNSSTFHYKE